MPTRKSLKSKGLSDEQIQALIDEGVEVTDPEPTIEELKEELKNAQKRISELNKENEKYRTKSNELDSLKEELETKLEDLSKETNLTKKEKEAKENELKELSNKIEEIEVLRKERDDLSNKLEAYEMKERQHKEQLLAKLPEDKRAKFENVSIEIIEEFLKPNTSQGSGKVNATKEGAFNPQTLEDLAKGKYVSKNEFNFVK